MTFWKVRLPMKFDLTLKKLNNTEFPLLYERFIIGEELSPKEYECLLAIAICLINATDVLVQQLGYRIIVEFCNQKNSYTPLYEISINKGLYPISNYIERHCISAEQKNFFTEWNSAFLRQYADGNIYRSEQQRALVDFFNKKEAETVSIIAPTSYGKSELILTAVKEFASKKICILTSSKALLNQTKKRIQAANTGRGISSKIIVHPEMYKQNTGACLAVLTQERLLRLFKKAPLLSFDCIVVDEAHELLESNPRSQTLANVIIVAQKRNPNVVFKFLTPFLADGENLKTRYTTYDIQSFKVSEYIKTEKYFIYDIRNKKGLQFYDQFLNRCLPIDLKDNFDTEEKFVTAYSSGKNIIYLNKPTDIEKFALALKEELPDVESELIAKACENISKYLQPRYNLLACLRKGIIYHHGSVPDTIRIYIEELYRNVPAIKYVVTSSTLLSGVNLPAERMFVLDNRRGKTTLSHDAFKNLVGRICRFSEIFDDTNGSLLRLEPNVYLVFGRYFAKRSNLQVFLRRVARVRNNDEDEVKNVLLTKAEIDISNQEKLQRASEFIENYEKGTIKNYQERYTKTTIGKACITNGISEIDVFANESDMQAIVNKCANEKLKIDNPSQLLYLIYILFIQYLQEGENDNLRRLENQETRNFYAMLLGWRADNKSYSEMIGLVVGYWQRLLQTNRNCIIYVGKWGDTNYLGSKLHHYTNLGNKNETQFVNLAIVRIKEEQDFIDNVLIRYVEVLNDLGLLEETFYLKIKYGTEDKKTICLLQNGLSLSSATLLLRKYQNYLTINTHENTVIFDQNLITEMKLKRENDILICEIQNCI